MILNCEWKNLEIHSTQRRREASFACRTLFRLSRLPSSRFQSRMLSRTSLESTHLSHNISSSTRQSEKIFTCFSCFEVFSHLFVSLLHPSSHSHSSQQVHFNNCTEMKKMLMMPVGARTGRAKRQGRHSDMESSGFYGDAVFESRFFSLLWAHNGEVFFQFSSSFVVIVPWLSYSHSVAQLGEKEEW